MTRWYVASLADGDTHLAEPACREHLVTARCDGRRFRPLAVLPTTPPDQAQTCPACRPDQPQPGLTVRQPCNTPAHRTGAMSDKDDDKHRDKEREKRDADGQRPINPDTVREPKPGRRGQ